MGQLAGLVLALAALALVYALLVGKGRRLSTPGVASRVWRGRETSESIGTAPELIVLKGVLVAFALSELAASGGSSPSGDNAIFGAVIAVLVTAMAASRVIYLTVGGLFSLLGVVAAVPQVASYLGLSGDCGFALPPVGRIAVLTLLAIIFGLSAFATVMSGHATGLVEGLLQSGLALYGGVSVLLFMATTSTIGANAGWSLVLGIIGACVFGAAIPRYPNLMEVLTGIGLIGITLLWMVEPAVDGNSAVPDSCMATSLDYSIMAGFIGVGLVLFVGSRIFAAIRGRAR